MQPGDETGLAPTQLGEVPVTEAHTAWALDPDVPEPPSRWTPAHITTVAVAASLLLIGGAGGVAVWQLESPTNVKADSALALPTPRADAAPTGREEPPPSPLPPPVSPPDVVITPETVTVTAAPPARQIEPVPQAVPVSPDLDRRFINSLRSQGWVIWDEQAIVRRARQVCAEFRQHASMNQIMARLAADATAEGNPVPYLTAEQFAFTALEVYPSCERA